MKMPLRLFFRQNHAMTLTELIIATVLIGIVVVGAASIDMAVRQISQGTSRDAIVAMRTTATMTDITKHASLATGHSAEPGIITSGGPTTLCIRYDDNNPPTPSDYNDDSGVCFTWYAPDLHRCEFAPWAGLIDCPNTDPIIGRFTEFQPTFVSDPTNNELYLEIRLTDCYDPSEPCGTMKNPEYTLTSRISPVAHSY